jgi:DNA-binding NtrC family response regulator
VGKELKVLIIEDDPADADRLMHELKRQGFAFQGQRVETRDDFLHNLEGQPPDLILSDSGMPAFSGFAALELVQEKCPQVPFVFVTGYYDQGLMVEMFDSGAAGYVYKNRLTDLGTVIRQAQEEVRQRRQPRAEEDPGEAGADVKPASAKEPKPGKDLRLICSNCKKVRDERGEWEQIDVYLRRHEQATVTLALCPACAGIHRPLLE